MSVLLILLITVDVWKRNKWDFTDKFDKLQKLKIVICQFTNIIRWYMIVQNVKLKRPIRNERNVKFANFSYEQFIIRYGGIRNKRGLNICNRNRTP